MGVEYRERRLRKVSVAIANKRSLFHRPSVTPSKTIRCRSVASPISALRFNDKYIQPHYPTSVRCICCQASIKKETKTFATHVKQRNKSPYKSNRNRSPIRFGCHRRSHFHTATAPWVGQEVNGRMVAETDNGPMSPTK